MEGAQFMYEIAYPFIYAWNWVERVGGFPGQIFAVAAVIMTVLGIITWVGNRK